MTSQLSGQCLCGAVKFTATPKAAEMGVCHCSMCRRWSGGAWMCVDCSDGVQITQGAAALGVYLSSDWGERCFCKECGSTLFWRMRDGSMTMVSVQAFDDPGAFAFTHEVFVDEQPANYAFVNKTHKMTGAELFAAVNAKQD